MAPLRRFASTCAVLLLCAACSDDTPDETATAAAGKAGAAGSGAGAGTSGAAGAAGLAGAGKGGTAGAAGLGGAGAGAAGTAGGAGAAGLGGAGAGAGDLGGNGGTSGGGMGGVGGAPGGAGGVAGGVSGASGSTSCDGTPLPFITHPGSFPACCTAELCLNSSRWCNPSSCRCEEPPCDVHGADCALAGAAAGAFVCVERSFVAFGEPMASARCYPRADDPTDCWSSEHFRESGGISYCASSGSCGDALLSFCPDAQKCVAEQCLTAGSAVPGAPCNADVHCAPGLVCGMHQVCAEACGLEAGAKACAAGKVCLDARLSLLRGECTPACYPIEQCAHLCGPGDRCDPFIDRASGDTAHDGAQRLLGTCASGPYPQLGASCSASLLACAEGYACLQGVCGTACDASPATPANGGCPTGDACGTTWAPFQTGLGVCGPACSPWEPIGSQGCKDGQACRLAKRGADHRLTGACVPLAGTLGPGADCGATPTQEKHFSCGPGLVCAHNGGVVLSVQCAEVCDELAIVTGEGVCADGSVCMLATGGFAGLQGVCATAKTGSGGASGSGGQAGTGGQGGGGGGASSSCGPFADTCMLGHAWCSIDTSRCIPLAWTCGEWAYADGVCDCGCGAPDPACVDPAAPVTGCAPGQTCSALGACTGIPPAWTCAPALYGDGTCHCNCGVVDSDCVPGGPAAGCSPGLSCSPAGTCATPTVPAPTVSAADFPRLDNATATLPLAMVVACDLLGVPWKRGHDGVIVPTPKTPQQQSLADVIADKVLVSQTHQAYLNLIDGSVDLVFVASKPSVEELAHAATLGVTLDPRPVALDALVFLFNKYNPQDALTTEQIRSVYAGITKSYAELGGKAVPIHPYYRQDNSGSQELLKALVMKGTPMGDFPDSFLAVSMGGLIDLMITDGQALGYSVFYFVNLQYVRGGTRLVRVDGVMPTPETIATRAYPLTSETYAVTRTGLSPSSTTYKLKLWLEAPEGQAVIKKSGYAPYKP